MDILLLIAGAALTFVVLRAIIRSDEDIEDDWLAQHPLVYRTTTDGRPSPEGCTKEELRTRLVSNRWL